MTVIWSVICVQCVYEPAMHIEHDFRYGIFSDTVFMKHFLMADQMIKIKEEERFLRDFPISYDMTIIWSWFLDVNFIGNKVLFERTRENSS